MQYDVVVVGAGPVGATAARYAALNGASVLLIEEHASVGSPVGCTGLLSTRAISECDVKPTNDIVLNSVRGAHVYSPNGSCLPIDGGKTKAYVVSRKIFDRKLATMAVDAGVDVSIKTRAIGLNRTKRLQELLVLQNGVPNTITANVIIGADGVRSNIAKMAGLGNVQKVLSGIQIEAPYTSNDADFVELFMGSQAPGFFGWTVPVSEKISRIGLAVPPDNESHAVQYLNKLLNSNKEISARCGGGALDIVYGGIPLGPLSKTVADGVLIVGDAAGQVKPTSGGGVYTGAACAKIAGEVAALAANEENSSVNRLNEYDERWRAKLGRELNLGMKIHEFMGGLSDNDLDELLGSMNTPAILDMITEYGDMDRPSILMKKMLSPTNSWQMMNVFWAFAKAVL
ncbi:MAG: NAD(P)/FAD-dependent oxidoreductase [Methanosarcinaceae archaeon]|nr:NAD(P)/FAD-dependent oxidoreductase [Methanosarcinaceae archaeon]